MILKIKFNFLITAVFTVMDTAPPEPFVDAARAAEFLSLKPRRLLELARSGELPAYPLGNGLRRVWRFRLSELAAAMNRRTTGPLVYAAAETGYRTVPSPPAAGRKLRKTVPKAVLQAHGGKGDQLGYLEDKRLWFAVRRVGRISTLKCSRVAAL
jgi:Helix-turn-helix domain